jgi:arylformamidase
VDQLDLSILVGPAVVVHAPDVDIVTAEVLRRATIPPGTERLLLRTSNSNHSRWGSGEFREDFVAITEEGAQWLVERSIRLIGVDYLSVGRYENPVPTHRILLEKGVIVVEGLNLHGIAPGPYWLACLPLKIVDGDGAPARAILIEQTPPSQHLHPRTVDGT